MPEIDVERKEPRIDFCLEYIVEEMLKEGMKQFSDTRDYTVTLIDKKETFKETITASFEIMLIKVSDTLLEKAKEEE
jgi:hypothetical protein